MRVQVARPAEHAALTQLPFDRRLDEWDMPNVHRVLGLHRHIVKLVEFEGISYVVKELPDDLANREYRLLREIAECGLPTAEMVAVVTERQVGEGLVVTRHLDYSLPYRSLLMGRGLRIPYLGDRMLDALVVLLVRIHLAGFFWGDCSLSNTLFRRDAGALQAYIIDVETGELHEELTSGQRELDLMIATDNVAGGLLDLQAAGRLADDIDPIEVALAIGERYELLWNELTSEATSRIGDVAPVRARLDRLHELGFDVEEMEMVTTEDGERLRYIPKVVEHGYHAERLAALTGLETGENQARRMLQDIREYGAELQRSSKRTITESVAAVRWLDQRFEPIIESIPAELLDRLEAAEIFHQLLEHRWYISEQQGRDVPIETALADYVALLEDAPAERVQFGSSTDTGELTGELPIFVADDPIPEGDPWDGRPDGTPAAVDDADAFDPWAHYAGPGPDSGTAADRAAPADDR
jgi:tRNA A-37 threonylcarbamoyl transferase component Bud32